MKKPYCPSGRECTHFETCVLVGCYEEQVQELVARTTAEQGLPEKITDPTVIRRVATLLTVRDMKS